MMMDLVDELLWVAEAAQPKTARIGRTPSCGLLVHFILENCYTYGWLVGLLLVGWRSSTNATQGPGQVVEASTTFSAEFLGVRSSVFRGDVLRSNGA
jgi:hypothetical protein